ncbi:hypothetical protein [Glutamicibacter sp.]|uniref:hypothetical protein n=1 Tax=Glutamicibacter sp. TaxID=1931995 RepID=UPI002B4A5F29|nr:hypothetical protein [Glutamicibacter sp.]HJX80094.1 hypothetical protein [Glutamicibacter sp.]
MRIYDAPTEAFAAAGFDPAERLRATTFIDSFVIGTALNEAASKDLWEVDAELSGPFSESLKAGLESKNGAPDTFRWGQDMILAGSNS